MIRIVVSDRSARVRSALRMRLELEPDMSVIAECGSTDAARRVVRIHGADVLVVDMGAALDALDAERVRAALDELSAMCALVVVSLDDRVRVLCPPAVLFVSKYHSEAAVVGAVRQAHSSAGAAATVPRQQHRGAGRLPGGHRDALRSAEGRRGLPPSA